MSKKIYGKGVNDLPNLPTQRTIKNVNGGRTVIWTDKYYVSWTGLLKRLFCEKDLVKRPQYREVSIQPDWLKYSKYREWCIQQESKYEIDIKGLLLDKDILSVGTKIYSPDTCIFVEVKLNNYVVDTGHGSKSCGSHWHERLGKYEACCTHPATSKRLSLGLFNTQEDGYQVYLETKKDLCAILVEYISVGNTLYKKEIEKGLNNHYQNLLHENGVYQDYEISVGGDVIVSGKSKTFCEKILASFTKDFKNKATIKRREI
ncbi:DNA-binding domain protein [Vibrio phage 1.170.O._10N.261.52.C3]|nr:DNA-binding domain protein [Vibrio phage 1.170.O._10N.261.52.C3]